MAIGNSSPRIALPQPFAEAERKASLNVRSIIRFTANSLRIFARRRLFKPEPAGAALAERLLQFGQDDFEFVLQRPRRVDDQESAGGERCILSLRRDAA